MVNGGVADLQLDHETTETTRSLGSKSNTQILGLTRDTQIWGIVATITTFVTVDAFTPLGKGITIIITPTEQVKPTSLINV